MALANLFVLANVFSFHLDIGGSGDNFVLITVQIGDLRPISYNWIQLLLILGISIVAAVVVERMAGLKTPGGILGAFIIALIGIWVFITLAQLTWNKDVFVEGIPLITAVVSAVLSIIVVHFLTGGFRKKKAA